MKVGPVTKIDKKIKTTSEENLQKLKTKLKNL